MRPPLSAASALRPHSSASIDRHKLPSLHSHNTSLPALYLPSQGQSQGSNETYSLRDVSHLCFFHLCIQWHCPAVTAYSNSILLFMRHCMAYLSLKLLRLLDWNVAKNKILIKNNKWYCVHALLYLETYLFLPASAAHCGPAMPCWLPHCFSITCPTWLNWSAKLSSCVKWAVHPNHTKCTGSVYVCTNLSVGLVRWYTCNYFAQNVTIN